MPPGAKKTPVSEAKLVAGFIHNEFYSPLAQERNRPARLTLSRLTVKQFKNAVADLINTNEWNPVVSGNAGGLKAQIYKTREKKKENLLVERTDPEVNFDFGTGGPAPEKWMGKNILLFGREALSLLKLVTTNSLLKRTMLSKFL